MSNANPEPVPITMLQLLEEEPLHSRKLVSPLLASPSSPPSRFLATSAFTVLTKTVVASDDTTESKYPTR